MGALGLSVHLHIRTQISADDRTNLSSLLVSSLKRNASTD